MTSMINKSQMKKDYGVSLIQTAQAMDFLQQIHSFSYTRAYFLERCPRHSQYLWDDEYTTSQSELWPRL